jgi:hypothetical protein
MSLKIGSLNSNLFAAWNGIVTDQVGEESS